MGRPAIYHIKIEVIPMGTTVANQLKSQSLDDVLSSAFKQVGGRVYPDLAAAQPLLDLVAIVGAYQATHLVAYGNAIPDTGVGYSVPLAGDAANTIVEAANNQVIQLQAVSCQNTGSSAPIVCGLYLGDTLLANATVAPSEHVNFGLFSPNSQINISKGQSLTAIKITGTSADIVVHASTVKSCL